MGSVKGSGNKRVLSASAIIPAALPQRMELRPGGREQSISIYYAAEDRQVLQQLACAYEYSPASDACRNTRQSQRDRSDLRAGVENPGRVFCCYSKP